MGVLLMGALLAACSEMDTPCCDSIIYHFNAPVVGHFMFVLHVVMGPPMVVFLTQLAMALQQLRSARMRSVLLVG